MSSIFSRLINLAGNVTGVLKVANGGTGAATLTSNGVLLGNTTSAITATTGTTSQVLVGGTPPAFGNVPTAALPAIGQTTAGVDSSARARLGSNTNDSAASGNIGEYISANTSSGTAPRGNALPTTIASVSLTAGDWDVEGTGYISISTLTGTTHVSVGISLTNNDYDSVANGGYNNEAVSAATLVASAASPSLPTGNRRISLSTTTTVYLVTNMDFTVDTGTLWSTNSFIGARRAR